ncbi:hypothetical protein ACFL1A_00215 [Patescibacteria group bacterium]
MKKKLYWLIIRVSRSSALARTIIDYAAYFYYKIFRKNKFFVWKKRKYKYFYHLYNRTVSSERVVEIPIATEFYRSYDPKEILEVGNVLFHYGFKGHDVIDKYEKGENVQNADIASIKLKKKYSGIVSVSTMEHVGYSYGEKKESPKFAKGVKNVLTFLKPKGKFLMTVPIFYNPAVSNAIINNRMPFQEEYFFVRTSFANDWKQVKKDRATKSATYDTHFANSNSLYIGVYTK